MDIITSLVNWSYGFIKGGAVISDILSYEILGFSLLGFLSIGGLLFFLGMAISKWLIS